MQARPLVLLEAPHIGDEVQRRVLHHLFVAQPYLFHFSTIQAASESADDETTSFKNLKRGSVAGSTSRRLCRCCCCCCCFSPFTFLPYVVRNRLPKLAKPIALCYASHSVFRFLLLFHMAYFTLPVWQRNHLLLGAFSGCLKKKISACG